MQKNKAMVGDILIHWGDGRQHILGRYIIETNNNTFKIKRKWDMTRRLGWAMVKQGIILVIRGTRKEEIDAEIK